MDRTLGAGKPVDPATRLSELLAQSLEELTRPFDPPRGGQHPARPVVAPAEAMAARPTSPEAAAHDLLPREEPAEPPPEEPRIDADKALAELEAELFAAARQVDSDAAFRMPTNRRTTSNTIAMRRGATDQPAGSAGRDAGARERAPARPRRPTWSARRGRPQAAPDADAARVIAKVRKLMLVSMAVTMIAVGSVFGFIGYRIFKGEGTTAKTADKLPPSSPIPTDMTLSLPRGARILQSAVANDRLLITLEIDGKPEVRTFDIKTLQPTGRLNFSATP